MPDRKAKILIVDDRPENLHAMKVTLAPLDAEFFTAGSGNEALTLMVKHEFAVVLLDVQMPGMDGFETAALMQNNQATRGVPIIFITAINKEEQHVFKGYQTGAVDYLFKPVNPDILLGKIQVFLNLYMMRVQREQLQRELLKVRNLESLGMVAGGFAHDFNNILVAILGGINLSLRDSSLRDETRAILIEAEKAVWRAKELTQQLLTFAKGGEPVRETTSLALILRDYVRFCLNSPAVTCQHDIPENLWSVDIDKGQIRQVIQHLVMNAEQAMSGRGMIEVVCRNVEAGADPQHLHASDGNYVKISIKDHGIGIPAHVIDKIFDPYFSTKQGASGLGLAITHSIIKKHGGHIAVESVPGVGSTFSIYLPATAGQPAAAPAKPAEYPAAAGPLKKARVMVMDDDVMVSGVVKAMLKELGHEVILAGEGATAVRLYKEGLEAGQPPDVVIMDLTISGGMGGQEAVQKVLALDPHAKVIVASGYSNDPIMAQYKKYGFSEAIMKPFQLEGLSQVIQKVLGACP